MGGCEGTTRGGSDSEGVREQLTRRECDGEGVREQHREGV